MATLAPNNKTADDYWKEINEYSSVGRYGEGRISKASDILNGLKEQVRTGQRSLTSYYTIAESLMPKVTNLYNAIAGSGSRGATAANAAGGAELVNNFSQKNSAGTLVPKLPFTRTEYASLPNQVLPTQDDVNKGFWDPTIAPLARYQAPTPVAPTPTPTPTPIPQPNPGPTPTQTPPPAAPVTPSPVITPPSAPQTTEAPYGGLQPEPTPGGIDAQKLLAEAELAKKLQSETLAQQKTARAQMMADLTESLKKTQLDRFNAAIPALAEHANTAGIYRSTGFGEKLADTYGNIERETSSKLGELGITSGFKDVDALSGIETNYLSGRNAAIGRQFSLDDFGRNIQIAKEMGASSAPQVPQGNSAKNALSGAAAGATAGSSLGPWGTAGGAVAGAIGGGSKKA